MRLADAWTGKLPAIHHPDAACLGSFDCCSNFVQMRPHDWPTVGGERDNPESSTGNPVLIFDCLVASHKDVEIGTLERHQQIAVLQAAPALVGDRCNLMAGKMSAEIMRDVLVEQDSQCVN